MDKLRAITIYAKSLLRNKQGSGELLNINHIFYEADRIIRKNGWEEEANKAFQEEWNKTIESLPLIEVKYSEYIKSGETNEGKEFYFSKEFHKFGVDGREEEIIKYKVSHNDSIPSKEVLKEIMDKRKEEDEKNALAFLEYQRRIYNGYYVDQDQLSKVTLKLIEHGLYEIVLNLIPSYISCHNAEELIEGYDSHFELKLY